MANLTPIKAYIVYSGKPEFYHAHLIFENGWCAFDHLCSAECFMPGDLWDHRTERQQILKEMGYEVTIEGIYQSIDSDIKWLIEKNHDAKNWKEMSDQYRAISGAKKECNS